VDESIILPAIYLSDLNLITKEFTRITVQNMPKEIQYALMITILQVLSAVIGNSVPETGIDDITGFIILQFLLICHNRKI